MLVMSWAMRTQSYASWGTMIVLPAIIIINAVLIWIARKVERDSFVTKVLIAGFIAKCIGIFFRYVSVFFIYNRAGDAVRYNDFAALYYQSWRDGVITWAQYDGKAGTIAMELITTGVYVFTGPSPLAGFYVFGSMAFWGVYLIFRAFRTACPEGRYRRYAVLLFLLPSLLYWPSSIGKESWILLFVGVVAYGAARFFTGRLLGLVWIAVGAGGVTLIRPHIAVLLLAALAVAQLLRPTDRSPVSVVGKVVGVAIMAVALGYFIQSSADFLGVQEVTVDSVTEKVEWAGGQTEQGGSVFEPVPLGSPLGIPAAFVTVLFRPFPWEASSPLVLLQSLEGLVLIVLLIKAWPQLKTLPRLLRTNPYVTFALAYVVGFVIAFSGFGNFGILARQRSLMLPFFVILLALPVVTDARRRSRAAPKQELVDA
ncbi:hypothetical protein [Granulicoccus sp. GXG6511]|uniref:hypothetical protein n=1 Tax=Granulicoccus sp. GXG6511 TaxID=3381351 RepID=UPI003D7CE282